MTRGRSASRKRSARGRSQTGRILRQPCRYYLKGTCARSPCEYWHLPACQFYKARDKCLFPHYKVEEQPSKKPKKSFQNGKSDDKGAEAIVKTVPQFGCVSQESEPSELPKSVKYRGNPRRKVWDQFDGYDSHSLRYVKQVSEKIKAHRLENFKSKNLISEVPTL